MELTLFYFEIPIQRGKLLEEASMGRNYITELDFVVTHPISRKPKQ